MDTTRKKVGIIYSETPDGCLYTCPCGYSDHHYMIHCTGCGELNSNNPPR